MRRIGSCSVTSCRYELFIKLKPSETVLFHLIGHFSKVFKRILSFIPKNYYCREDYVHFILVVEEFGFL